MTLIFPEESASRPNASLLLARRNRRWFWLTLLLILLMAAFLRLYALDMYPQMFNQDEATSGYDAWSLWITGRDQHDDVLPVYFRNFNDYVPPVTYYLTAPFVGLFGLSITTTRLPAALMGIAAILLVALLGRRWFSPAAGLIAALLLTLDPWNVNYSRIAFPTSALPFLTTAALYSFTRAAAILQSEPPATHRWKARAWLTASALSFGLLTGAYTTMKLEAPILFAICLLAAAPLLWRHRWLTAYWLFVYLVCIDPLLVSQIIDWNNIQQHFDGMSALSRPNWLAQSLRLYLEHFDPTRLFINGFGGGVGVHPPGVGELFWLEGILWLGAAVGFMRRKFAHGLGFSPIILLVLWFLAYPIADSLTLGDGGTASALGQPHEVHSYNFLPLPELLAGFGAVILWQWLKRYRFGRISAGQAATVVGAGALITFSALFLAYFFGPPMIDQPTPYLPQNYHIGLELMLDKLNQVVTPCDVVWITPTNISYIYYLFFTRYSPQAYQQFSISHVGLDSTSPAQIGQVHFALPDFQNPYDPTVALCPGKAYRVYDVAYYAQPQAGWQQIAAFTNSAGRAIWQLMVAPPPQ